MNHKWIEPGFVHQPANATTLILARAWLMFLWVVYFLCEQVGTLRHLDIALFHSYGIAALIPNDLLLVLHEQGGFVLLKYILISGAVWVAIGARGARGVLSAFSVLASFYLAYTKGFGGHANHQELTLLYMTFAMIFLPVFDQPSEEAGPHRNQGIYSASMFVLCSIVVVQYVFIGLARLAMGFPATFAPGVMMTWIAERNLRPNPWGYDWARAWFDHPAFHLLVPFMMPVSTLMEILTPLLLFLRGAWAWFFVLGLAFFHLSIFALMHIPFFENMGVLLLLLPLTPFALRMNKVFGKRGPAIVFFDGDCSLCNSFVQFVLRYERHGNIRFAPLFGETYRREVGALSLKQNLHDVDSVIYFSQDEKQVYVRSQAIAETLKSLGSFWVIVACVLGVWPRALRDRIYSYVARHRIAFFGTASETCRLPTPEERERILN